MDTKDISAIHVENTEIQKIMAGGVLYGRDLLNGKSGM